MSEEDKEFMGSECRECNEATKHEILGVVPAPAIYQPGEDSTLSTSWVEAIGCTVCGTLTGAEHSQEQVAQGEEKVIDFLVDNGFITEEEENDLR